MTKVNTLFGEFDDDALKKLKGYVSEVVLHMHRNDANNAAIKDIIEAANDELKIPKKIIKRMAKADHKNSFQTEVAENKEYESLYESMKEIK